jgi:O-antigen ligase
MVLFWGSAVGSVFFNPLVGVLAYLVTYHVDPRSQWWIWGIPIWAARYALILGSATFLGMIFRSGTLKYKKLLDGQEILLWVYVAFVTLSLLLGLPNPHPQDNFIKMAKVAFILFLAGHIITTLKRYETLLYALIFSGLVLGINVYTAPRDFFNQGRFQAGIGGSDFSDGNVLSGHFLCVLPLLGIIFIKGKWWAKCFCMVSALFMVNSIIQIKSRGSFLAIAACTLFAILLAKKVGRKKILPFLLIGIAGGAYLMDPGYLVRMRTVEETDTQQMDGSSASRLHFWGIAIKMAIDYPLGIGEGNYLNYIANYDAGLVKGRDTHNTYLRCLAELGFQGLIVLLLLIVNSFRILSQISKKAEGLNNKQAYLLHVYALRIALIGYLVVAFFISATYVEDLFWILMYPLFLKRCIENEGPESHMEAGRSLSLDAEGAPIMGV